ncbi:MinD/ParA family ATP-binding protein [Actinophytocola xinjiangensis]|uniref:MinD/ParA family ATP-binding protein n=1 Tax=Actinophytocola xinjiangensis TaxID=485602 RepID=UPI000A4EE857|nr:MinD/ParA family protein [Actinophytocola xinjiangensis]
MSGREHEPDTAGAGQDFSWLPSGQQRPQTDADAAEDFGPQSLVSTEAVPPGAHPQPHYTEPNASGPHQYVDPATVSNHPVVDPYPQQPPAEGAVTSGTAGTSGPHPPVDQQYANPNTSGPHQYVEATPSGPQQYANPNTSGPHQYVEATPSGPQQYANPNTSGPHATPPGGYPQGGFPPGYPAQAQQQQQPPRRADELSSAKLIKQAKRRPQSGWRKAVYVATGHLVNVGESPSDVHRRELIARVNQPLRGCYKIAMLSLKGGVGKTTTTTTLGSTFASLRGDRVIAVDANPDRGTLSQKIPLETTATVRHLLRDADRIHRYSDIRAYTSQGPSRLEVLASEQDPAVSEAFSEDDYRRTVALLEHFYNIVLTDCGTGLMHSAMKGVLDIADALVIVSSGSVDGARSASATLDWLDVHGYRDLVSRSVAVINSVRPRAGSVDLDKLGQHFGSRCRAVCRIPFDPHLEEGAEIELDRLGAPTRLALLDLAATVADGFPSEFYYMR